MSVNAGLRAVFLMRLPSGSLVKPGVRVYHVSFD
jgi:hypothetical protein